VWLPVLDIGLEKLATV